MRSTVAALAVLAVAGDARAQAPGEVEAAKPAYPRFAVGGELGGVGLHRADLDTEEVSLGVFGLFGRYRVVRSIELGLSVWGGSAEEDRFETVGVFVDARYRFLASSVWNVFAGVSLGGMSVQSNDRPSRAARTKRGTLRFGAGVERSFGPLAFDVQLRLLGIGDRDFVGSDTTSARQVTAASRLEGGALTLGLTYYF